MDFKSIKLAPCKDLSLYIHIPFCEHKCYYCDFFSITERNQTLIKRVLREFKNQIDFLFSRISPEKITSVYLGGGTPSVIQKSLFEDLLHYIASLIPVGTLEFSVEANPESLDEEFISLCEKYGVTRLSVGIQTLSPRLRTTLGRRGDVETIEHVLELIKYRWIGDLNCDLLCGIPGQKLMCIQHDLENVIALNPTHVSLYTLTLEPGTVLHQQKEHGLVSWPTQKMQDDLWLYARELLLKNKYTHYEISNFSLAGKECRHNLRYWLLKPYIGVGPGAVSTVPVAGEKVVRLSNPRNIPDFLQGASKFWNMEVELISERNLFFEQLMLGLRLKSGIPKTLFERRFGCPLPELIPELWGAWNERGFVKQAPTAYALTLRGRLILNQLLHELARSEVDFSGINIQWP